MSQASKTSKGIIARLQEKIPDQKVGLVPADAFFLRKTELPAGLADDEADAFIQLDMEGNSPFPMEQLAWGYLRHQDSPHAMAYATPKSRLKKFGAEAVEQFFQLFPGFITMYGLGCDEPVVRFVSQSGVVSAIFLDPGKTVPAKIISRKITAEIRTDQEQLATRLKLLESLDAGDYSPEEGLWLGEGYEIAPNGSISFLHRHVSPNISLGLKSHSLDVSGRNLWAMDLRDGAYASRESMIRQKSSLIWKSLLAAGWTAAMLLLLQLGNWGLTGFSKLIETKINKIEPYAIRVENKMTLADKLTQSTEEDIKPFNLLEAINPLRPDSIFFERVRCRSYNELELEGQSTQGVTPVNAFADSINQLSFVESVENNSQTVRNQTSFEFVIKFSEIPPPPEGGFIVPGNTGTTEEGSAS